MPELFLNKYETYKNKENKDLKDNLKIQLFKNFRSRENILNFTNIIFQDIMSGILGDIEYNEEEYLNLGADYSETNQDLKTEIDIINLVEEQDSEVEKKHEDEELERLEDVELEAKFVANRIKQLIEEKFEVWDKKKNTYRDIEYKDIVVLLRSTSNLAPLYEQEILSLDMPVFSDSSQEYLDSIEIQTIMSLLKIIDNPMQDIPLVTVLRSFIGKFTDDELVQIRLSDKYDDFYTCMKKALIDVNRELKSKIENFFEILKKWRKEQEYLSLDEFIWKIYMDTGFYNYVGLMPNGELRQANLKMLFQKAKKYESANFKGLYNFINFIDKLKLSSGDMGSAKLIGENDNVIRIMSIHKSKGLEFPLVFLSSTGKQFNLIDLNQNLLLHQDMGIRC
jgi:ATP-dependent helicase/nuclease subunit A